MNNQSVEVFSPPQEEQRKTVEAFSHRLRQQGVNSFIVLLATSDQQISEELSRAFENTNIEFLTVNTAKDLIVAMAERQINLMIFDPGVTKLKGLEILHVVKKLRPEARVIVISSDLSFETRETLVKERVIYQMQKSMEPGHISQVVTNVVTKLHPSD